MKLNKEKAEEFKTNIQKAIDSMSPEDLAPLTEEDDEKLKLINEGYGNLNSVLLKDVIKEGFKPIAITVMLCEETFVFETEKEASDAWEIFKHEGWWYGKKYFERTRWQYLHDLYADNFEKAPKVHWLK